MSTESIGGDYWYQYDQTVTENSAIISQMISAWGIGTPYTYAGWKTFVPVGFKFTLP
jgi:hypothetical protein